MLYYETSSRWQQSVAPSCTQGMSFARRQVSLNQIKEDQNKIFGIKDKKASSSIPHTRCLHSCDNLHAHAHTHTLQRTQNTLERDCTYIMSAHTWAELTNMLSQAEVYCMPETNLQKNADKDRGLFLNLMSVFKKLMPLSHTAKKVDGPDLFLVFLIRAAEKSWFH